MVLVDNMPFSQPDIDLSPFELFMLSLNSYAAKDTICSFFYKKDPKLSLSELLSMMARIQFNPTLFI
jgi:hypothetical protein